QVSGFFTCAVTPLYTPTTFCVAVFRPLLLFFSMKRPPPTSALFPYTTLFRSFNWIWALVPVTVLVPPSCSVRPPSSENPVELNRSAARTSELPSRRALARGILQDTETVSVPVSVTRPPDWVSAPTVAFDVLRP